MNPKVSKRAYDKLAKEDLDALVEYMMSLKEAQNTKGSITR